MKWFSSLMRPSSLALLLLSFTHIEYAICADPYQTRILEVGTAFLEENNGVWTMADVAGNGYLDLVYIKTRNTGSGRVEVHVASASSNFRTRTLSVASDFAQEENGTWLMGDFDGDGRADLIYIKTKNTPNNKVEIHVASAASNFQRRIYESQTVFNIEDNGTWTMAPAPGSRTLDLVYIKTRNTGTGRVEVHIASASSNYRSFSLQTGTTFAPEDNGVWLFTPFLDAMTNNLVYLKTSNTGTRSVEIHVASGKTFDTRSFESGTTFAEENNGSWLVGRYSGRKWPDLIYIKTSNTGTNSVEVHISPGP